MDNDKSNLTPTNIPENILKELKKAAKTVSQSAYAPYSHFPVGAAVLTDSGEIYSGCNVENASLGLTICAERNAIFQAVAHGTRQIRAVVIYTPTSTPSAPCGSCRQVINEFGSKTVIYSTCDGKEVLHSDTKTLLPQAFGPDDLK